MVYTPEEDSYLLEQQVKDYINNLSNKNKKEIKVLDMGSGSGIQAKACINAGIKKGNVLCADIDNETIKFLKKQKLQTIKTNLFDKIKKNKKNKFDLIIFNAPYLPEDEYDKQVDTTAGKKGYEVILNFLKQGKQYLTKSGKILLLISNLSKPNIIKKHAKKLGFKLKLLAEKKLFFEKLFVYQLDLN